MTTPAYELRGDELTLVIDALKCLAAIERMDRFKSDIFRTHINAVEHDKMLVRSKAIESHALGLVMRLTEGHDDRPSNDAAADRSTARRCPPDCDHKWNTACALSCYGEGE